MTTPPDVILGLSPADRAELTRLLVEHERALGGGSGWIDSMEALAAWTRARLALIAAQGPRSTMAL